MAKKPDLLPGTLDMLILKTLTRGPLHGYRRFFGATYPVIDSRKAGVIPPHLVQVVTRPSR